MGKTLFWYLFKDLLRIFLLASVVIAGIMSFGGLLRPLTRHGLDVMQVISMWAYMMPAMMTYSLPVAAVFATSIVYGRLSADNELTACRAAGIGYGAVVMPAVSLGLVSALTSLVFLSFVVPFFSLQVEQVVYSNVAKFIASEIQRSHEFSLGKGKPAIFAREAYVPSVTAKGEQVVVLVSPTLITYSKDVLDPSLRVPKTFSLAREVTLYIRQSTAEVQVWGVLKDATTFSRILGSRPQVGLERLEFGPISMPPLVRQNVKFMDVGRLKELAAAPEQAERVKRVLKVFVEDEQNERLTAEVAEVLRQKPMEGYTFRGGEQFQLLAPGAMISMDKVKGRLIIDAGKEPIRLVLRSPAGRPTRTYEARRLSIDANMDNDAERAVVSFAMEQVRISDGGDGTMKLTETQVCSIPMPDSLKQIRRRKAEDYIRNEAGSPVDRRLLQREVMVAGNEVITEMHARASFALSCLVLVLVGAVLGMQFRSGDFLSAFSVSVIPALVTITLVMAGTQYATDVSVVTLSDPIWVGLALIWMGNILAAGLTWTLFNRLRRT